MSKRNGGTWVFDYIDGQKTSIEVVPVPDELYAEPHVVVYDERVSFTYEDGRRRIFPLFNVREFSYVPHVPPVETS